MTKARTLIRGFGPCRPAAGMVHEHRTAATPLVLAASFLAYFGVTA